MVQLLVTPETEEHTVKNMEKIRYIFGINISLTQPRTVYRIFLMSPYFTVVHQVTSLSWCTLSHFTYEHKFTTQKVPPKSIGILAFIYTYNRGRFIIPYQNPVRTCTGCRHGIMKWVSAIAKSKVKL